MSVPENFPDCFQTVIQLYLFNVSITCTHACDKCDITCDKVVRGHEEDICHENSMPSRVMRSHLEEKQWRLGANGLVERPGLLRPGELERRYYGGGGGGGGCRGGGGTTDGGGGGHHRRNDDDGGYQCGHHRGGFDAAGGGGGGGGGVASSGGRSRACVEFGHCRGRLRRRHRPSSTSAIVAAVD